MKKVPALLPAAGYGLVVSQQTLCQSAKPKSMCFKHIKFFKKTTIYLQNTNFITIFVKFHHKINRPGLAEPKVGSLQKNTFSNKTKRTAKITIV